jgi:hypothetical protein
MTFALGERFANTLLQHQLPTKDAHYQRSGKALIQRRQRFYSFGTKQDITVQLRLAPEFEQQLKGDLACRGDA